MGNADQALVPIEHRLLLDYRIKNSERILRGRKWSIFDEG